MSGKMKPIATVMVCAPAVVVRTSNAHGLCYQVRLGEHDFDRERLVWVNPEETLTDEDRETLEHARDNLADSDLWQWPGKLEQKERAIAILERLLTPPTPQKEQK
jgi:hypothetical protein